MALVVTAAVLMAFLFLLFKVFDRRRIPLMPAIAVNYVVALIAGMLFAQPWNVVGFTNLWPPALAVGVLFLITFYLTGLSAQRAGVAATTVASRMSLVLTVIAAVILYDEDPGLLGWFGIAAAVAGVALASLVKGPAGSPGAWKLPVMIFFGNAAIDISVNYMQRMHLDASTEAVFPAICFVSSAVLAVVWVVWRNGVAVFTNAGVLIGGGLLGIANYAALLMMVRALAYSGLPASSVYPLMNVCVIILGTLISIFIFSEKLSRLQWLGIGFAVLALALILQT